MEPAVRRDVSQQTNIHSHIIAFPHIHHNQTVIQWVCSFTSKTNLSAQTPPDCFDLHSLWIAFQERYFPVLNHLCPSLTTAQCAETKIDKWMHERREAGSGQGVAVATAIKSFRIQRWQSVLLSIRIEQQCNISILIADLWSVADNSSIYAVKTNTNIKQLTDRHMQGLLMETSSDMKTRNNMQASILGSFCCIGKKIIKC